MNRVLQKNLVLVTILSLLVACSNPKHSLTADEQLNTQNSLESMEISSEQWLNQAFSELPLSAGDRVRITVEDGEAFSGVFEVNVDGSLHIPYLDAIPVASVSVQQAQKRLTKALIEKKMYQSGFTGVSVKILQWAKIQIMVEGAVFKPGRVLLNDKRVAQQSYQQTQESGDNPINRYLTAALKGAGGIRPDADLTKISIIREGKRLNLDVSGVFNGLPVKDVPLIAGDRVLVPSLGKIQTALIRPSQITPPGFQVFMSNLSQPVSGNAQAAISKTSRSLPYGTRLLEAAMAANCMGGSWVNSSRKILYSSKNQQTKEIIVQVFELDEVVSHAAEIEKNPYLMPDDGLACYDSDATNIREAAKFLSDILDPVSKLIFFL